VQRLQIRAVHKRVHTGERQYACDHEGCGASFATSGHLTTAWPWRGTACGAARRPEWFGTGPWRRSGRH
jgi:hypothetical protein